MRETSAVVPIERMLANINLLKLLRKPPFKLEDCQEMEWPER